MLWLQAILLQRESFGNLLERWENYVLELTDIAGYLRTFAFSRTLDARQVASSTCERQEWRSREFDAAVAGEATVC